MKKHIYLIVVLILSLFFFKKAIASEIKYDRHLAIIYAQQWCGVSPSPGYNTDFICMNCDRPQCARWITEAGEHKDCANFVSQCLIAGGISFDNSPGAEVIGIGGNNVGKKGYPAVSNLLSTLSTSYCFKADEPYTSAKEGDVLSEIGQSHVTIYDGSGHFYGHTHDRYAATVHPWAWIIYHFQGDDANCKECKQDDFTGLAAIDNSYNKCQTCDSDTGDVLQKCYYGPDTGDYYLAASCSPVANRCDPMYACNADTGESTQAGGGVCPDDTATIGTGVISTSYPPTNSNSSIGILGTGFAYDTAGLLKSFNEEARIVPPADLSPSLAATMPLLIIPSGGFSGLDTSDFFKTALAQYVSNGGNVLMLTQQHGIEFSVLPGGLGGYGYVEDVSCQTNSSYIDTWNPVLAGQTRTTPSLNVDGYFSLYPDNATVLLRRTANGQPAVLMYQYGAGHIIASTVYTDTAFTRGEASTDEINLIRDIIAWAKKPAAIPEIKAGETANINLHVTNNDLSNTATAAEVTVYDPNKSTVKLQEKIPLNLAFGQSTTIPLSYTASSTDAPGIYKTKYDLLTQGYQLLTSEEDPEGTNVWLESLLQPSVEEPTGRFAIENPPQTSYKTPNFNFSVQSASGNYLYGSNADFTVYMFNNTTTARTITAKYFFPHDYWATYSPQYGGDWTIYGSTLHLTQTLTIPAKGNASFNHELDDISAPFDRLWAYFYDENGNQVGMSSRGFFAVSPNITISTSAQINEGFPNDSINVNVTAANDILCSGSINLKINVYDPQHSLLNNYSSTISFLSSNTANQTVQVPLPQIPLAGTYFIEATALNNNGQVIASSNTSVQVAATKVVVTPQIPSTFASSGNNVSFNLSDVSTMQANCTMTLNVADPTGGTLFNQSQNIQLSSGQSNTIGFNFDLGQIKPGYYTLSYSYSDNFGIQGIVKVPISSTYVTDMALDKALYKEGDQATITLKLSNTGKVSGNVTASVSIPDINYNSQQQFTSAAGSTSTETYTVNLPTTVTPGDHIVNVTVASPAANLLSSATKLTIDNSRLIIDNIASSSTVGNTISIPIENTGGVGTTYQLTYTFQDSLGKVISQNTVSDTIQVNGLINIPLILSSNLVSGTYSINLSLLDTRTNITINKTQVVSIQGINANLNIQTGKDEYLNTEIVNGNVVISNTSPYDIDGGQLNLQVNTVRPDSWNNPQQISGGFHCIKAVGNTIWLGSKDSIAKFDGINLTVYDSSNTPYLENLDVSSIEVDNQGNIWFGGLYPSIYTYGNDGGGALKFDGQKWTFYNSSNTGNILSGGIYAIIKDIQGNLWFAIPRNGVVKYDGSNWYQYTTANTGAPLNSIICLACDPSGNIWMGSSNNGVIKFDGKTWTNFNTSNSPLASNNVTSIKSDNNGIIYIASGYYVSTYNNGTWGNLTYHNGRIGAFDIFIDNDNTVYLGDESVFLYQDNALIQEFDTRIWDPNYIPQLVYMSYCGSQDPLYRDCQRVAVDASGNKWFADGAVSRVCKYNGTNWSSWDFGPPQPQVNDLKIDSNGTYWLATDCGVGTYSGNKWGNHYDSFDFAGYSGGQIEANGIAIDSSNNKWFCGLGYYSYPPLFECTNSNYWSSIYDNTGTASSSQAVAAENNIIWVGTYGKGLGKYDPTIPWWGSPMTVYNTTNSGIASNYVYSIAVDSSGKKWIGTDNGISVFDGSNWNTYNTANSGLLYNGIWKMVIDKNNVKWILDDYDNVVTYNGNSWVSYNLAQAVNLSECYVTSIFVDSKNNKWFPFSGRDIVGNGVSGVIKYDGTNWTLFNETSGLLSNNVYAISEDPTNNAIVFATDKGISRYMQGIPQSAAVWQTTIPVNLSANSSTTLPITIGALATPGKYILQGQLQNNIGQLVSTSSANFYVSSTSVFLKFSPDKAVYKTGSTVTIQGEVDNNSSLSVSNVVVSINSQINGVSTNIYNYTIPSIQAGGNYTFTATIPASAVGTVGLNGSITQNGTILMSAIGSYVVANPSIIITTTAPTTVDNNPFTIKLQIQNTGTTDASVHVSSTGQGLSDQEDITLSAGEIKLLQYTLQITSDQIYSFNVTGDTNQTISKTIAYGLAETITQAPSPVYSEGTISIPVTLKNTGQLNLVNSVNYDLYSNGAKLSTVTKTYSIQQNATLTDNVVFYGIAKGNYQLISSSVNPSSSSQSLFSVKKIDDLSLSATTGQQQSNIMPITISAQNNGYNDFSGSLVVDAGFYKITQAISVNTATSQAVTINLDCSTAAPGNHNATVSLVGQDGQIKAFSTIPINILNANIIIEETPSYPTFEAGGLGNMTFKIKNTGGLPGQASLHLQVLDVLDKTVTVSLNPGDDIEVPFSFGLPEDLQTDDYFANYSLTVGNNQTAQNTGQVKFHIDGINIGVQASTDKTQYNVGDTAVLTINVNNLNSGTVDNLFARVNYGDYESRQDFTISNSNTLTFNIPLTSITGEKLFYGIYDETGRSIYLNSMYIYQAGQNLNVSLDKQTYDPGDMVTATISGQSGALTLSAPGFTNSSTINFTGNGSINFALPYPMTAGTYGLTYQLRAADGSVLASGNMPFDVNGYQVKVPESTIDKGKYSPTDTINTSLTINSNSAIPAVIKTWIIDPSGKSTATGETEVNLTTDSNLVQNISVPINTTMAGIHKLVYGIYDQTGLMLCSGSNAFDVGDAVLLGASTDKAQYPTNTEPVKAVLNLFGTSSGNLSILVDNNQEASNTVTLNGFSTMTTVLPNITPGPHTLTATLLSEGLTSQKTATFDYGTDLPILTVSGATFSPMTSINCTLSALITNSGKTASVPTSVAFYDGDPANGGQLIGSQSLGGLQPEAIQQVTQNWNILGKAGAHTIYVVADPDNLVVEYNRQNNQTLVAINLPEILMNNSLPQGSYNAHNDVSVSSRVTDLSSTTAFSNLILKTDILNPSGSTITEKTDTIASVAPMGVAGVVTTWNTDIYAPGNYSIGQTLTSAAGDKTYAYNKLGFTILPTVEFQGSISLSAQQVFIGQDLGVNFNVNNYGNVPIQGGTLMAEVLTADTSQQAASQSQALDLAVAVSTSGAITLANLQVPAGNYILSLVAVVNGTEYKIAESPFTVLPPLKITKMRGIWPRVLCYVKDLPTGPNPAKSVMDALLAQDNISYQDVTNPADFETAVRSGLYNVYLIVENQEPYQNLTAGLTLNEDELVEAVNSGNGMVFIKTLPDQLPVLDNAFGATFNGNLKTGSYTFSAYSSLVPAPSSTTIETGGVNTTVTSGKVVATLASKDTVPAIITNLYGQGRSVLFTFDAADCTDPLVQQVLTNSLYYVTPMNNATEVIPLSVQPITVEIKNLGKQLGIRLDETIPGEAQLIQAAGATTTAPLSWLYTLGDYETKDFDYMLRMPSYKATIETDSSVSYLYNGQYNFYKSASLTLNIDRDEMDIINDITASLSGMTLSSKDANLAANINSTLSNIASNTANTKDAIDTNISDLTNAIDTLEKITSADTSGTRLDMDKLLVYLQAQWSLAN